MVLFILLHCHTLKATALLYFHFLRRYIEDMLLSRRKEIVESKQSITIRVLMYLYVYLYVCFKFCVIKRKVHLFWSFSQGKQRFYLPSRRILRKMTYKHHCHWHLCHPGWSQFGIFCWCPHSPSTTFHQYQK